MNLIERVKNKNLPIKQLRVIESILDDLEENSFLTGNEICSKFDISFSSLTRMSQSLDYSGFPELKKEIECLYKREHSPTSQAESFISDSKDKSILSIVYQSEINNLKKLRNNLSEKDLLLVAKNINKSKRIFIIGVGQLKPVAQKLSAGLNLLSKNVISFTEVGFSKMIEVHSITKSDTVIIFSMNKELIEMKEFMSHLSSRDIFTALFTDKKCGHLRRLSDVSFYTPSNGNGMINCLTPFIVGTNILESFLFSLDKHVHLTKIKNIEKSWNSLPIFIK